MSLVARHLEAAGIPTVIIGSAIDIVTQCKVPRFLFVDFPLGNPCGKPGNGAMQQRIVSHGLQLLTRASSPETIEYSDESWGHDDWKTAYMEVSDHNRAALRKTGDELRANRQVRQKRDFS
ncbi:MAG: D-proline reductase (dithiol) PrdB [Sulfitobacter sp.]